MTIDTNTIAPATEAGRNFSLVARTMERSSPALDLTDDENFIVSSEEGKTWKIAKYAQNRYRIYDKNGRSLVGSNDTLKSPHIKFEKPSFKTLQIFRIEQA